MIHLPYQIIDLPTNRVGQTKVGQIMVGQHDCSLIHLMNGDSEVFFNILFYCRITEVNKVKT